MFYQTCQPSNATINSTTYCNVIRTLRYHVDWKCPDLHQWILHHNNAKPRVLRATTEFLENEFVATCPHPPYSPDLAPCNFWLFPYLKKQLQGQWFSTRGDSGNSISCPHHLEVNTRGQISKKCYSLNGPSECANAQWVKVGILKRRKYRIPLKMIATKGERLCIFRKFNKCCCLNLCRVKCTCFFSNRCSSTAIYTSALIR